MLPFTKRASRQAGNPSESSEVISTGEIEVLRTPGGSHRPAPLPRVTAPPQGERGRVFQRSVSDDEDRTLLMSSKTKSSAPPPAQHQAKSQSAPPPSMKPVPPPSLKGLVRPRVDEERTILRPMAQMQIPRSDAATRAPQKNAPAVSPAMMPTPYMAFKPGLAAPPLPSKPPAPKPSDPPSDVPAAVITTRTRILRAKPTVSWAAALMALGIFTGLVTAVVARGDADSLLDATASLVDPSAKHAPAAAAAAIAPAAGATQAQGPTTAAAACTDTPTAAPIGVSVANAAPVTPKAEAPTPAAAPTVAINTFKPAEVANGRPEPPKPPPVAFAAPARPASPPPVAAAPAPKPVVQAAPRPAPQAVAVARPAPAPKPAPAPAAEPKASPKNEMESATAADALAKAQLEASLR